MDNNEFVDGLKSARKETIDTIATLRAEGIEAIQALDKARESGDEGLVSEASEKVERVGAAIKAAQDKIDDTEEQLSWFKEYADEVELEAKSDSIKRLEDMRALFEEMRAGKGGNKIPERTVGEHFGALLKYRGIDSIRANNDLRAETKLVAYFDKTSRPTDGTEGYKDMKSLYINHGVELEDASDPVPGFMGAQCGLVEDRNIACLLDPPQDDFEECITQSPLNGNRIRFTREVARDEQAASVLETVYNPYPTLFQDGTKPEGSFTLATVEVSDSKIAEFVVASDEVLEDCGYVASLIDNFLITDVNKEKRRQLINGSGLNGEMRGILNQPDLIERAYQDVGDGGAATDNYYDTFRRGLTDLWLQGANTDNVCIIMHPRDGEAIDLTKDEFGRYLFNDMDCFQRTLRCLKIRYSVDIPQGTAVMGNFSNNWVFFLRKALEVRMGYTGDQFITNTNTILAEMRGLSIVRCPRKILKITGLGGVEESS